MKLRGFTTKWILREAVRDILPAEILTRKKMGFPVPFARVDAGRLGRRGPRRAARLAKPPARHHRPAAVERLIAAHAAGEADGADAIWSLLNLELWYRTHIDGDGVQTTAGQALDDPVGAAGLRATA